MKVKIKNFIFSFTTTKYIEIKKIKLFNYLKKYFTNLSNSLKRKLRTYSINCQKIKLFYKNPSPEFENFVS